MERDNRNRGSIWKNEKKVKDSDPDFLGTYTGPDGLEFWVSAWLRRKDASPRAPALTWSTRLKEEQPEIANRPPIIRGMMGEEITF